MHATGKTYLPAAGRDWLLPFYDPFTKVLGVEASHRKLINQASISPGHRVLEIGCGTGKLAILVKRLNPASQVLAINPDPKALARAHRKAQRREDGRDEPNEQEVTEGLRLPEGNEVASRARRVDQRIVRLALCQRKPLQSLEELLCSTATS